MLNLGHEFQMLEEVKVFGSGSIFWCRCPLIAISKLLLVLTSPNLHGCIFAIQGFLIRTTSHNHWHIVLTKVRFFFQDFDWGLLKPFDQSKTTKHIWFNQQCFPYVYSRVSLLWIAQNPYFSRLSVWVFIMHVSIIQWCKKKYTILFINRGVHS